MSHLCPQFLQLWGVFLLLLNVGLLFPRVLYGSRGVIVLFEPRNLALDIFEIISSRPTKAFWWGSDSCFECMATWLLIPSSMLSSSSRAFSGVSVVFNSSFCISRSIIFAVIISRSSSSSRWASWQCSASALRAVPLSLHVVVCGIIVGNGRMLRFSGVWMSLRVPPIFLVLFCFLHLCEATYCHAFFALQCPGLGRWVI